MPLGREHLRRSRDAPTGGIGLERSTSNLGRKQTEVKQLIRCGVTVGRFGGECAVLARAIHFALLTFLFCSCPILSAVETTQRWTEKFQIRTGRETTTALRDWLAKGNSVKTKLASLGRTQRRSMPTIKEYSAGSPFDSDRGWIGRGSLVYRELS